MHAMLLAVDIPRSPELIPDFIWFLTTGGSFCDDLVMVVTVLHASVVAYDGHIFIIFQRRKSIKSNEV